MKKTLIALLVVLVASMAPVLAQKPVKLGHVNSEELMQIMPGRDSAMATLEKEVAEMENTLKAMSEELEKRYEEYVSKRDAMSDLIRQTKEKELTDMQARAKEFQTNAQKTLQERQNELLKPIIDRARAAIKEVAAENGFTYIFDEATGPLLYSDGGEDIMPLVKKKLGL